MNKPAGLKAPIEKPCWVTLGGSVKPNESLKHAAFRILEEKTGISEVDIGPIVWHGQSQKDQKNINDEYYFLVRLSNVINSFDFSNIDVKEKKIIEKMHWWNLQDIKYSNEIFIPKDLYILGSDVIMGNISESPIEIDLSNFFLSPHTSKIHIFFDIDGVLIPQSGYNPTKERIWDNDLFNETGIDPNVLTKDFFIPYFKDILLGKIDLTATLTAVLLQNGYNIEADKVIKIWFNKESQFDQNLLEIISNLKNRKEIELYIASNQSKERHQFLWNEKGLNNYFSGYYISSDLGKFKNNKSFFEKINVAIKSGKKILIDDSMANIKSCQEAGWEGIHYQSKNGLRELNDWFLQRLNYYGQKI